MGRLPSLTVGLLNRIASVKSPRVSKGQPRDAKYRSLRIVSDGKVALPDGRASDALRHCLELSLILSVSSGGRANTCPRAFARTFVIHKEEMK